MLGAIELMNNSGVNIIKYEDYSEGPAIVVNTEFEALKLAYHYSRHGFTTVVNLSHNVEKEPFVVHIYSLNKGQ